MIIKTNRFGEIEVDETLAIHFPDGLLGFPEQKDYVILEHKPHSPFFWLQSTTTPDLAFVVTNPILYKEDYLDNLPKEEKSLLRSENDSKMIIFAIVTIPPGNAENATVNLLGPLAIDPQSRIGRQLILANSGYNHRHPIKTA